MLVFSWPYDVLMIDYLKKDRAPECGDETKRERSLSRSNDRQFVRIAAALTAQQSIGCANLLRASVYSSVGICAGVWRSYLSATIQSLLAASGSTSVLKSCVSASRSRLLTSLPRFICSSRYCSRFFL